MLELEFEESDLNQVAERWLADASRRSQGDQPLRLALSGPGCSPLPTSPTYGLIQEYRTDTGNKVVHVDLYRLNVASDWLDLDLEAYGNDFALWVEWPEKASGYLPSSLLVYRLEVANKETPTGPDHSPGCCRRLVGPVAL
jgi:hypothetical protein